MIPKQLAHFRRVHGNLTSLLCRLAFLIITVLNLVRGEDTSRLPYRTRSGYATTYQLDAGWNLVGINLNLDEASRNLLLDKGAMTLDESSKTYAIDGDLAPSQACWIFCKTAETITLSGSIPPKNFDFAASLKPGWKFVSPLVDSQVVGEGTVAWGWNGRRLYPTDTLLAGHGYFVHWAGNLLKSIPEDTYLVIDLSEGASAASYPVSYRSAPPAGGWTEEYKTTKLVLRKIPAGTFTMGSPKDELGRSEKEIQHQVTLTKEFYVGVFEVTQRQWSLVMGDDQWPSYFKNPSCRDSRPVEQVSYEDIRGSNAGSGWPADNDVDANSFLGKLREKTGLDFDLPTGAQWEYACRAGTTTALNSGKDLTDLLECPNMAEVGRYCFNGGWDDSAYIDTSGGTATVGSYKPNRWGLYDMHGNVLEWCLDWWDGNPYSAEAVTDPKGDLGGSYRTLRGSSYVAPAQDCRSARRALGSPSGRLRVDGFRLTMVPAEDTYLVIDLSAGAAADAYPVSHLASLPPEGWTEEYKTTKLVLRKIPAGTFIMGSPEGELGRLAHQETQHEVTLTKEFYVGVFEVTQRQWSLVMGEDKWPSHFSNVDYRDLRPVEKVSYNDIRGSDAGSGWPTHHAVDAGSFLGRLRDKTGLNLDLPTEAQWEYACRAGTTTALHSGENLTNGVECWNVGRLGRYKGNSLGGWPKPEDSDTTVGTAAVGSHRPNGWGLYDMYGNVSEICLDWWDNKDYPAQALVDPRGDVPGDGVLRKRIQRGGSFNHDAHYCRSAKRYWVGPEERHATRGFRLVQQGSDPEDTYLVVDLSAGSEATSYPISYLAGPPAGRWTDEYKTTKLVLRKIPAGTFIMGSPEDEVGHYDHETQHQVTLANDYYVGVFEVTQKQWSLVMGENKWPSHFSNVDYRDSRPVEKVSYNDIRGSNAGSGWPDSNAVDANSFLGRLRAKTGLDFDLPTEAQWEYACRAGTTTALNSGKNLTNMYTCPNLADIGRYRYNGGMDGEADAEPSGGTATVGSHPPNCWGLYDMHGNVWEWCLDWWNASDYPVGEVTNPKPDAGGHKRIMRGGSRVDYAYACRSANRSFYAPSRQGSHIGFRLVGPVP